MEKECFFCPNKERLTSHHIIPQKLMGDFIEDVTTTLCKSCHSRLEHLTRMIIFDGEFDENVQTRFRNYMEPWLEATLPWETPMTRPPIEVRADDELWLDIVRFAVQVVMPLWEEHKKKTVEEIINASPIFLQAKTRFQNRKLPPPPPWRDYVNYGIGIQRVPPPPVPVPDPEWKHMPELKELTTIDSAKLLKMMRRGSR